MESMINRNEETAVVYGSFSNSLYSDFVTFLDVSEKSRETYGKAIKQMFLFFAGNNITQPTREDLIVWRESLKENHKPTTVQSYVVAARLFFKWAAQIGAYRNIADNIKGVKLDREHKKDCLTSSQAKAVISEMQTDSTQGLRDYAIVTLMLTAGLRTVEISRANLEDLRPLGDNTVLYIQGKGHSERTEYVKISAPVETAIREYLKARPDAKDKEPLFTSTSNNSAGKRLSTRTISGIAKKSMQEAGYNSERLTAHSFRHTAVTLALLGGEDITAVSQFARHRNITTTQIYNHALEKAKNSCVNTVSNLLFS